MNKNIPVARFVLIATVLTMAMSNPALADTPVDIAVSGSVGTFATFNNAHVSGGGSENLFTGGFAVQITTVSGTSVNLSPHATFCTELGENVSFTSYTNIYEIVPLQYATAGTAGRVGTPSELIPIGGIGLQAAAEMRFLFDNYYISENLSDWSAGYAQAFQLAVWEIGHDPSNFTVTEASGGVFYIPTQSNAQDATIALAQSMLTAVDNANVSTGYTSTTVDIWSLADANGIGPTTGYQDILFATVKASPDGQTVAPLLPAPVPEPTTLAALVVAGIAGLLRRRRA